MKKYNDLPVDLADGTLVVLAESQGINEIFTSKSFASNNGNVYKKFMESVELKLREIDNRDFVVGYTKKVVEILGEPEMSLEVKAGQISEDVTRLVESLGYQISDKKPMEGWIRLKAVKTNK